MAKTKQKFPTVGEGVSTTATALKLEVMELMEGTLKKLENGLAYLEKELHELRASTPNTASSKKSHKAATKNIKGTRARDKKQNSKPLRKKG